MAEEQQRDNQVRFTLISEQEARRQKLLALREKGINPYPNRVQRTNTITDVLEHFEEWQTDERDVTLTGRIRLMRDMGKAAFAQIEDGTGRMQIYFRINDIGEDAYKTLKLLDIGDFVQVRGFLFITRTGERTLHVREYRVLAKGLRPLPEKYHGLEDVEVRQRKRYLDLVANGEEARRIFVIRSRTISAMRRYLDEHGFLEVETPILQPLYGGATARPFITHHNTLDRDLYLRIAVELYHKRLIVGGIERVYEIGHDFRNEGMDRTHNPEFTMLEAYQAYADYTDIMELTEAMVAGVVEHCAGTLLLERFGTTLDFTRPFARLQFIDAVQERCGLDLRTASEAEMRGVLLRTGGEPDAVVLLSGGRLQDEVFKTVVEPHLVQPTFVLDYPKALSPLAKEHRRDPALTERFELFVNSRELANAFSELNDPDDQRRRFEEQGRQRAAGDEEAHGFDANYIRALE